MEKQFTLEQMLEAIQYGFTYHRDSMNDDKEVPDGNKVQWIIGKYVPIEEQHNWLEKFWKIKNKNG